MRSTNSVVAVEALQYVCLLTEAGGELYTITTIGQGQGLTRLNSSETNFHGEERLLLSTGHPYAP